MPVANIEMFTLLLYESAGQDVIHGKRDGEWSDCNEIMAPSENHKSCPLPLPTPVGEYTSTPIEKENLAVFSHYFYFYRVLVCNTSV